MKIACGTVIFRKQSLNQALRFIKKAGYDYVEVQAIHPWCPHIDIEKDDPHDFRARVEGFGFKGVTAIWMPHGTVLTDEKSVHYGELTLSWASQAGIPVVHIGDGFKPEWITTDDAFAILKERLVPIIAAAEKHQVFLAVEPHGTFSLHEQGLLEILSISRSPWFGVNYDTANIHRAGYVESGDGVFGWKETGKGQDEKEVLRSIVDRVVHVHVKDIRGKTCVPLGTGGVDIKGCLGILRDHGYEGAISLETEGQEDQETAVDLIRQSRAYLCAILNNNSAGEIYND